MIHSRKPDSDYFVWIQHEIMKKDQDFMLGSNTYENDFLGVAALFFSKDSATELNVDGRDELPVSDTKQQVEIHVVEEWRQAVGSGENGVARDENAAARAPKHVLVKRGAIVEANVMSRVNELVEDS